MSRAVLPIFVTTAFLLVMILVWLNARRRAAIREAVRARREAAGAEARYRALVGSLDAVVWEADAETLAFRFVSKQAEALFGYSLSEWIGSAQMWRRLIHQDDYDVATAGLRRAAADGEPCALQFRCVARRGQQLFVRGSVQLDRSAPAPVLRGVLVDVTAERHAREALSAAERELAETRASALQSAERAKLLEHDLRHAQRMEALGRLAGGIAHDFNNMLTAIRGHLDLLRMEAGPNVEVEIQQINDAADRAAEMTRQLMAFRRERALEVQRLDLNELITETHKLLARLIGENISISTVLDASIPPIEADRSQLEQVLLNLALNARDAMPKGGALRIRTANAVLTEIDTDRFASLKPGNYVLLAVSDDGPGSDLENGSGVALATAHAIVKQLEGHISWESRPNTGNTFRVYLPPACTMAAAQLES